MVAVWIAQPALDSPWIIYGVAAFGLLTAKILMATIGEDPTFNDLEGPARWLAAAKCNVAAIIPVHNEDPEILARCVLSATMQPDVLSVVVIDDGSTDPTTIAAIDALPDQYPGKVRTIRFDTNKGKRWGLHAGVRYAQEWRQPDLYATIDSDTVLDRAAVSEAIVRLYSDDKCAAATGLVRARNWRTNVLTRLQDLRYAAAFLWERAAYSRVGAVLCVCGSFTVWRGPVLERLVDPLVGQTFLGEECTFGDDRHLTNLALAEGRTIRLAERAVADTLVPERFGHWLRQQSRWSRSFVRESWWAVRHFKFGWPLVLTVVELVTWVVFSFALAVALVVAPAVTGRIGISSWLLWVSLMSWVRAAKFPDARRDASWFDRWLSIALAPVYGVLHLVIVVPLRVWALATMRRTAWGTRTEIEVAG